MVFLLPNEYMQSNTSCFPVSNVSTLFSQRIHSNSKLHESIVFVAFLPTLINLDILENGSYETRGGTVSNRATQQPEMETE